MLIVGCISSAVVCCYDVYAAQLFMGGYHKYGNDAKHTNFQSTEGNSLSAIRCPGPVSEEYELYTWFGFLIRKPPAGSGTG